MVDTLDLIQYIFQAQYASLEWRKNSLQWDLDEEIKLAKTEILNSPEITIKNYHAILKRVFNSAQDYHVGIQFFSTESASLPFQIKGANGHYFFSYIDRKKLSPSIYPIKIGDELILFDGKPIQVALQEFKDREVGPGETPTRQALAETLFTARSGAMGHEIPKGPLTIKVKDSESGQLKNYQLIWEYTPEDLQDLPLRRSYPIKTYAATKPLKKLQKPALAQSNIFQKPFALPFWQQLKTKTDTNNHDMGSKVSFIPHLGHKIWQAEADNHFDSYIYQYKNKMIGYLRIPHYIAGEKEIEEFQALIQFLENESDALIIDQVNNPGGSVFYLYALASMLTEQPLTTPKHKIAITQKEVTFALEHMPLFKTIESDSEAIQVIGDTLDGNPVSYQMAQFFLNYFRFIVDEWNQGHVITDATYLWGIDHINPHPISRYTKPILVLINSLDFSGGDFFPAIMQDNKRALLLGTRTAGAGGYVLTSQFPNLLGIDYFHYTASMAVRDDQQPIENSGIIPDIEYKIDETDLKFQYVNYLKAIHQALDTLIR